MINKKKEKVALYITREVAEQADEIARVLGISAASFIETIVKNEIESIEIKDEDEYELSNYYKEMLDKFKFDYL